MDYIKRQENSVKSYMHLYKLGISLQVYQMLKFTFEQDKSFMTESSGTADPLCYTTLPTYVYITNLKKNASFSNLIM